MSAHKGEEIKGRLKEAVGDLTGNTDLRREGKLDEASAATKRTIDSAAGKIKQVVESKR
jgi:uncharacterized protein YjbJ (UPF0337 family)